MGCFPAENTKDAKGQAPDPETRHSPAKTGELDEELRTFPGPGPTQLCPPLSSFAWTLAAHLWGKENIAPTQARHTKGREWAMLGHTVHRQQDTLAVEQASQEQAAVAAYDSALIQAPDVAPKYMFDPPTVNYEIKHVYGYRGYDCRQNLYFVNNSLAYHIASVGIVLNLQDNSQVCFGGSKSAESNRHNDDILCLAVSPDRTKVATGQFGHTPVLFLWDPTSGKDLGKCEIPKDVPNAKGIGFCAFSADSAHVAFADLSPKGNVYVAKVGKTTTFLWTKPSGQLVCGISWSKKAGSSKFASCGRQHINFWDLQTKTATKGTGFGDATLSCVTFDDQDTCYAGADNGTIYAFKEGTAAQDLGTIHKGVVEAISWTKEGLITAGQDKKVQIYDKSIKPIQTIACSAIPRAVDCSENQLAVGDKEGNIVLYELDSVSGSWKEKKTWWGHHGGETWGLAATREYLLTSGEDNKVLVWNNNSHELHAEGTIDVNAPAPISAAAPSSKLNYPPEQCSRAIAFNEKTEEVAIGTNAGQVFIRDLTTLHKNKKSLPCGGKGIRCLSYSSIKRVNDSPDPASTDVMYLAVGGQDCYLYLFKLPDYTLVKKLAGHKYGILALDWTVDSTWIRSIDEKNEMCFWKVGSDTYDKEGARITKNHKWATQTCKVNWASQGIFPIGTTISQLSSVAVDSSNKFIVTGDAKSLVNIFCYPCPEKYKHKCQSYRYFLSLTSRAHSEEVVRVLCWRTDSEPDIFSAGGKDKAIIHWKASYHP